MIESLLAIKELAQVVGGGAAIFILFFLWQAGLIKIPFLKQSGKGEEQVPPWADKLIQHFNHETTEQNREIKEALDKFGNKLEEHDDIERETLVLLREIKEYGVPCRERK